MVAKKDEVLARFTDGWEAVLANPESGEKHLSPLKLLALVDTFNLAIFRLEHMPPWEFDLIPSELSLEVGDEVFSMGILESERTPPKLPTIQVISRFSPGP